MRIFAVFIILISTGLASASNKVCSTTLGTALRAGIESLRIKPRQGWINRGIPLSEAETVWQHSNKVADAADLLFSRRLPDFKNRAKFMAQFHDLGEHGANKDFTPADNISASRKHALERDAISTLFTMPPSNLHEKILAAWLEYEDGKAPVARIVKDLDKIDAGVQAMVYWLRGYKQVADFFKYTQSKIKDDELSQIFNQVLIKVMQGTVQDPYAEYFKLLKSGLN